MNGVSLDALASRDTPILRQCVITETLVYDFIVKFTTLLSSLRLYCQSTWIAFHDWIDRSKAIFPSMQHRMFLHSDFGEWLAVKIHGEAIRSKSGASISTRDLFRDHQVEDLGRVVTLAEWLREIDDNYWAHRRRPPRQLEQIGEEPAEGLAARWGGVPGDYLALIDFFDKPCEFAPDNPDAAAMITHNSFGIRS